MVRNISMNKPRDTLVPGLKVVRTFKGPGVKAWTIPAAWTRGRVSDRNCASALESPGWLDSGLRTHSHTSQDLDNNQ